jgi:hypothetical protein
MAMQHAMQRGMAGSARRAKPGSVIRFGSQARGNARVDRNFDVMVVEHNVTNRIDETVRLSRWWSAPRSSITGMIRQETSTARRPRKVKSCMKRQQALLLLAARPGLAVPRGP